MVATETLTLPSGATAEVRTDVDYGAVMDLEDIGARIAATLKVNQETSRKFKLVQGADGTTRASTDIPQPGQLQAVPQDTSASVEVDPESLAQQALAQRYFAVTYMLTSWSFPAPLPTLQDLSPLRRLGMADGRFLQAECQKRFDALSSVDFSPTPGEGETPFGSLSGSEPGSEASPSADTSPPSSSDTASSS